MDELVTAFGTEVGEIITNVALVFGAVIGLAAVVALGYFVVNRVRGAIR